MPYEHLCEARKQIEVLCNQSKRNEHLGHETVKNTFLGGMRDGESWGLRRWLSKNGGALKVCNDLELIFQALQKLDRDAETTKIIAKQLRPVAAHAYKQLKRMVPQAYQEVSSAHPYLPFFHRLESSLNGLSNFDPEDDDVVIIDDEDEIQEVKNNMNSKKNGLSGHKRPKEGYADHVNGSTATKRQRQLDDQFSFKSNGMNLPSPQNGVMNQQSYRNFDEHDEDEDGSDIEIVCVKNASDTDESASTGALTNSTTTRTPDNGLNTTKANGVSAQNQNGISDNPTKAHFRNFTPEQMSQKIEALADHCLKGQVPNIANSTCYWSLNENYAFALRIFALFLREPRSSWFVDPVDERGLLQLGRPNYRDIIINPLCFRDIFHAIISSYEQSQTTAPLQNTTLTWDMWSGSDLLQAIDLVFLNALAYNGKTRSSIRVDTLALRNRLWVTIQSKVGRKGKEFIPTKRGECSGFVVFKSR